MENGNEKEIESRRPGQDENVMNIEHDIILKEKRGGGSEVVVVVGGKWRKRRRKCEIQDLFLTNQKTDTEVYK